MATNYQVLGCPYSSVTQVVPPGRSRHPSTKQKPPMYSSVQFLPPSCHLKTGCIQNVYLLATNIRSSCMVRPLLGNNQTETPSSAKRRFQNEDRSGRICPQRRDLSRHSLGVESVGEFITRLARRMYDMTDSTPHTPARRVINAPAPTRNRRRKTKNSGYPQDHLHELQKRSLERTMAKT